MGVGWIDFQQPEDHLFTDPWAAALAGEHGEVWIEQRPADSVLPIVLRTRYLDDWLQRITVQDAIRINSTMLTHPLTRQWIEMQAQSGAPWVGTMDDPVGLLAACGWSATLSQAGASDATHGRWPYPVIPTTMPAMPHNWYVVAEKE